MKIRAMTVDDIPFAMRLKAQNHWNQLEADWRRQLDLEPTGCFVAEVAEKPVGTACACVFDDVAWINMVLVDKAQRGQGIGTALMVQVVEHLEHRGVATMRLDATALGQPVYEKLGFVGDFVLERYEGILPSPSGRGAGGEGAGHVSLLVPADLRGVFEMDAAITKTNRAKLLDHLYAAAPDMMRKYAADDRLAGYCLCRPGANAWQIGPLQGSSDAGTHLLLDAARRLTGQRVYFDVPTANAAAIQLAQSLGLIVQRPFLRMSRGRRLDENLRMYWAAFGPEKG